MIRHIVMFKIKDEFKDEIPQLVKNFYGMPVKKRMHEVRSASVACDYEINS